MKSASNDQITGPFLKLRSSFREIFGRSNTPVSKTERVEKDSAGKDPEKFI